MCTIENLTEDSPEIEFPTDYLFLSFLRLPISKAKFRIGHFAVNHKIIVWLETQMRYFFNVFDKGFPFYTSFNR